MIENNEWNCLYINVRCDEKCAKINKEILISLVQSTEIKADQYYDRSKEQ
jgi:hypothetical protein